LINIYSVSLFDPIHLVLFIWSYSFCRYNLMFLPREIDIKMCQIYSKIHIYATELQPMRVQYTGHVSLSVSREK